MKRLLLKITPLFILIVLFSLQISKSVEPERKTNLLFKPQKVHDALHLNFDYGKIPLYFIRNEGQVNGRVLYYAKTPGYTLWVTKEGLIFDRIVELKKQGEKKSSHPYRGSSQSIGEKDKQLFRRDVSRLELLKAHINPEVIPVDLSQHRVSYLSGKKQPQWKTNIQTSRAVLYRELYKKIDLKIYGVEEEIEYDFIVKPGGNASDIRFEYKNTKGTRIDSEGNLVIKSLSGEFRHASPMCYQAIEGEKIEVRAAFKKIRENTYTFEVGKYDGRHELIIDPLVQGFSTFLGGNDNEISYGMAVDTQGAVYVSGVTFSTNFPTKKPIIKNYAGRRDAFVTKINPAGNALVYSTYLCGSRDDLSYDLAVDSGGSVYVTGYTDSKDFPVKKALFKNNQGGNDVFITKISPEGKEIVFSTYIGGSYDDVGLGIRVDSKGAVYVGGSTYSNNFPTKNAVYTAYSGKQDAFLAKLNRKGKPLVYSTYLGGTERDYAWDIALDSHRSAYITGATFSTNFPTKKAFQKTNSGSFDVFVAKIAPNGKTFIYTSYLGGNGYDGGHRIFADSSGAAYITGFTWSTNFPTHKALRKQDQGGIDAFVAKIKPKGKALVFSSYLGGSSQDEGWGISVDSKGAVYVSGLTSSTDFPTKKPLYGTNAGSFDVFLTKIKAKGSPLIFSTFLGGSNQELTRRLVLDALGAMYICGSTKSGDFPVKNPYQRKKGAIEDSFITKLEHK
jgi:hypothetical protein